jgi:hypothetical protein
MVVFLSLAFADPVVHVSGFFALPDGAGLDGAHAVEVALFSAANSPGPEWDDEIVVMFEDGRFSLDLGEGPETLTLDDLAAASHLAIALAGGT